MYMKISIKSTLALLALSVVEMVCPVAPPAQRTTSAPRTTSTARTTSTIARPTSTTASSNSKRILCTITDGSTILTRKGVKGYFDKNGNITRAQNTDANYDKAKLLTYYHTNSGGFFGLGGDNGCKCANKDIPKNLAAFCQKYKLNSSQGRVLAVGKQVRSAKKQVTTAAGKAADQIKQQASQLSAAAKQKFEQAKAAAQKHAAEIKKQVTKKQAELQALSDAALNTKLTPEQEAEAAQLQQELETKEAEEAQAEDIESNIENQEDEASDEGMSDADIDALLASEEQTEEEPADEE